MMTYMTIEKYITPKADLTEQIRKLLVTEFGLHEAYSKIIKDFILEKHFEQYIDTLYALIEIPYVDKVFRDSYYHYFSSKLNSYNRDCIRVSLFDGEIKDEMFRRQEDVEDLSNRYLGFIVIRPTVPHIIGRSVLSPNAKKEKNFNVCTVKIPSTVDCIKFTIEGFPHSSQDTETITCAETTVWAIMEYFSNKYAEYKPVLPSKIIETLNKVSSERQIPSKGLNIQQISFALKEFGFGTRIYSKVQFLDDFERLLSCYVESGLPIIVGIENGPPTTVAHAMLCIGHSKIEDLMIDNLLEEKFVDSAISDKIAIKNLKFFDFDSIEKEFIFIDDNHPAFQKSLLETPAKYYGKADWDACKITHFIAPFYTKIYLEAYEAKSFAIRYLLGGMLPLVDNTELFIRFYLTSSRSYKNEVALNQTIQDELKVVILETAMPKFIWVTEISSKDDIKRGEALGLIIIDATEAKLFIVKPLLLAAYNDTIVTFDPASRLFIKNTVPLHKFQIYTHNLKGY